jgi:large subunit ribosomal protein L24
MRIVKGDRVVVRSGKYKGRRAEVVHALPAQGKVILEGVNVAKRHAKPTRHTMQGGIIDKFMPVHVSSVSLLCKSCGEPTRVGLRFDDQGRKLRVCRKCEAEL